MGKLTFVSIAKALPNKKVTNEELAKITQTTDEWITLRTGIMQRYFCTFESCNTLAQKAAKNAILKAKKVDKDFSIDEIGLIIVATCTGDYLFPSTACTVAKSLGLGSDVMAFDINAGCSGFMYSLQTAKSLLCESEKKYALVIGSEELSKIINFEDRSTCVLFGDGAAAAIIKYEDNIDGLTLIKSYSQGNDVDLFCKYAKDEELKINMHGQTVFKFAVGVVKDSVDEILNLAGLEMNDIDFVVCHQANARIIDYVKKQYIGNEDKFYQNVKDYANTSSASIGIALNDLFESGQIKNGMKVLCVGFGAGLTWSAGVFEI